MAPDSRWQIVPCLVINDVTMTSLLLLKIIDVLPNFLILSDTLLFKYFCSMASSRGIWTLPNNLEILRHNDVKLCHVSIKLYLEMLEIISALICVHLVETIPR